MSQFLQQYVQLITQSEHCIGKLTMPAYLNSCIPGFAEDGSSHAVVKPGQGYVISCPDPDSSNNVSVKYLLQLADLNSIPTPFG
jgi:hypothetical protein